MEGAYLHGYAERESARLRDQAGSVADLLHGDTAFPPGSRVLEAGCGVGAQTLELLRRNPGIALTGLDRSAASLSEAERSVVEAGFTGVDFVQADLTDLWLPPASFDHVFVCFVLEHLRHPADVLSRLTTMVRPGGTLTAIEGDHGSTMVHPESAAARAAIACQVELQRRAGGDPMIGRRLYPLLAGSGLAEVRVSPRVAYADGGRPEMAERFTLRTFTAMIAGVRDAAVAAELSTPEAFERGLDDLRRSAAPDGTFCYTFFKGVGVRPGRGST